MGRNTLAGKTALVAVFSALSKVAGLVLLKHSVALAIDSRTASLLIDRIATGPRNSVTDPPELGLQLIRKWIPNCCFL